MMKSVLCAVTVAATVGATFAQEQRPTFRAAADLLVVEAQVVDRDGQPIPVLGPDAFEVTVGGKKRTVVSADLVQYAEGRGAGGVRPPSGAPTAPSSIPKAEDGRLFIFAVDEHSFTDKQLAPMMEEARKFLDKLQPQDHVGLFGFPTSKTFVNPTRNHNVVRQALGPALGVRTPPDSNFNLSPGEIIDLSAGDKSVQERVGDRECPEGPPVVRSSCINGAVQEAKFLGSYYESHAKQSMAGITALFKSLAGVPGRKTVVLLSGGMLAADRIGGRPDISAIAKATGQGAADANATLYVLHANTTFDDMMSVRRGRGARTPDIRDTAQMALGLQYVAGAANGYLIDVGTGSAEVGFNRVLRETAAFYILGVATEPGDRDGKVHFISVKVKEPKDTTVRHRNSMVVK
jgi:VWFA-related protein